VLSESRCALIKRAGSDERTIVSKNWIKQLHTLPVLHFKCCLTTEYSEKTAHFNGIFDTDNQIYVPKLTCTATFRTHCTSVRLFHFMIFYANFELKCASCWFTQVCVEWNSEVVVAPVHPKYGSFRTPQWAIKFLESQMISCKIDGSESYVSGDPCLSWSDAFVVGWFVLHISKDNGDFVLRIKHFSSTVCNFLTLRVENAIILNYRIISQPFNVGIKSLHATLADETFYWDFSSWTVHFVNICVKNQQMHQLFIQFINYVW
jgi:hypothetical protein